MTAAALAQYRGETLAGPRPPGALVTAAAAGGALEVGDVVVAAAGEAVVSAAQFHAAVARRSAGDELEVEVVGSDGEARLVRLELGGVGVEPSALRALRQAAVAGAGVWDRPAAWQRIDGLALRPEGPAPDGALSALTGKEDGSEEELNRLRKALADAQAAAADAQAAAAGTADEDVRALREEVDRERRRAGDAELARDRAVGDAAAATPALREQLEASRRQVDELSLRLADVSSARDAAIDGSRLATALKKEVEVLKGQLELVRGQCEQLSADAARVPAMQKEAVETKMQLAAERGHKKRNLGSVPTAKARMCRMIRVIETSPTLPLRFVLALGARRRHAPNKIRAPAAEVNNQFLQKSIDGLQLDKDWLQQQLFRTPVASNPTAGSTHTNSHIWTYTCPCLYACLYTCPRKFFFASQPPPGSIDGPVR